MKTDHRRQRLLSTVQLFRVRVATAESELELVREQAREAKARRKEAKRIARQMKRQFKQSRAELSKLKKGLAHAEAELSEAGGGVLEWTTAKLNPAMRGGQSSKKRSLPPGAIDLRNLLRPSSEHACHGRRTRSGKGIVISRGSQALQ